MAVVLMKTTITMKMMIVMILSPMMIMMTMTTTTTTTSTVAVLQSHCHRPLAGRWTRDVLDEMFAMQW